MAGALQNPNSPFKMDRSLPILQRNRYANIQPWDNARVRLKTPIGGSDYINASPIRLHSPSQRVSTTSRRLSSSKNAPVQSPLVEYHYIATQGPKEGQFTHFWHMVMQETVGEVGVIIMLTPCFEGNKEKCAQYFPTDKANPVVLPPEKKSANTAKVAAADNGDPFLDSPYTGAGTDLFGTGIKSPPHSSTSPDPIPTIDGAAEQEDMTEPGQVHLISTETDVTVGCEVRTLRLTIGSNSKTIIHYLFAHWPDFGKPEAEEKEALLKLMKLTKDRAGESPRVVHCSAGVGRTGTFVALDFLVGELEAGRLVRQQSPHLTEEYFNSSERTTRIDPDNDVPATNKAGETFGKSGIAKNKVTTPELPQSENGGEETNSDLIHDTVELLRQQRMMMVMNELQYSLLYEVLKDAFKAMYAEKELGATIVSSGGADHDLSARPRQLKAPRLAAGDGKGIEAASGTEGPLSPSSQQGSEADTEIADTTPEPPSISADPYAQVAPEEIVKNLGMNRKED